MPDRAMDVAGGDVPDLRDYLAVLKRRKWTVFLITIVVVGTAMGVTLRQDPVYEAEVRVLVAPTGTPGDDSVLREIVLGQTELETQRELVRSVPVAERALERLELDESARSLLDRVTVDVVSNTQLIEIRTTALQPDRAAAITQAMAESYLDSRRDRALDQALSAAASLQDRVVSMRERLDEIDQQLGAVTPGDPGEQQVLNQEREALLVQLGQVSSQLASLRSAESFARGGGEIVEAAEEPITPVSPRPVRTGVLALVLGVMLGVGLAFLRDHFDDAVRSDDEVVRLTHRPVLGHVSKWTTGGGDLPPAVVPPVSPVAEAYRTLRTNLKFMAVDHPTRSLMVTSARASEGKTTTAANLAVAAARMGERVLLIGADLRRPALHNVFDLRPGLGLSEVLAGEAALSDAISDVGIDNLRVLRSGDIPPNPSELLAASRMSTLMGRAPELADLVIYDVPPLLGLADALELVPRVDGVVLVVDGGQASRSSVRGAATRVEGVGGRLLGSIMNRMDPSQGESGYYYYAYEATGVDTDGRKRRRKDRKGRRQDKGGSKQTKTGSGARAQPWPDQM